MLGFAAWSGTGKTTLLSKVLKILVGCGFSIGVVKHAHHSFDIEDDDRETLVWREAGVSQMVISSGSVSAIIVERDATSDLKLDELLHEFRSDSLDLVLVEGFKREAFPKIELHRDALGLSFLFPEDSNIIALATDGTPPKTELPVLDLNQVQSMATFIIDYLQIKSTCS